MTTSPSASRTLIAAAAALAVAALLSACDRGSDTRTAGEKLDAAVATVDQKTDELKADAKVAGEEAKVALDHAADSVANTAKDAKEAVVNATDNAADSAKDATITAAVKSELARDDDLSAVGINVDTTNGRVQLTGKAPTDVARLRATTLAANVKGVASVDNKLVVAPS